MTDSDIVTLILFFVIGFGLYICGYFHGFSDGGKRANAKLLGFFATHSVWVQPRRTYDQPEESKTPTIH